MPLPRTVLLFLLAVTTILPVEARRARPVDASTFIRSLKVSYDIRSDGSYHRTVEREVQILKEPGVEAESVFRGTYNTKNSSFHLLEARSTTRKQTYPVPPGNKEDKPRVSSVLGFDTINQVLARFSHMEVGSSTYVKFLTKVHTPAFKNFFSLYMNFLSYYIKSGTWEFRSELPLHTQITDPGRYLRIKKWKRKNKYHLRITLKKAIYIDIMEEKSVAMKNLTQLAPQVVVSTAKDWKDMVKPILGVYDNIIQSPIPAPYKKIIKQTAKISHGLNQINAVTSRVSEKLRYFGDWRPINGGYVPRPLSRIADSGFGDCKDMSVVTAALLRRLGYTAHVALVERGDNSPVKWSSLPFVKAFNHAIVWIKDKQGREYWVDPTNSQSYAQGIPSDIAEKSSLILAGDKTWLKKTPALQAKESQLALDYKFHIIGDKYLVKAQAVLSGLFAVPLTGLGLVASKKNLDYHILSSFASIDKMHSWKLEKYHLSSRIVKDIQFQFQYDIRGTQFGTTAGRGFPIHLGYYIPNFSLHDSLQSQVKDRVADLYLGFPKTLVLNLHIKNAIVVGNPKNLNCNINSPWVKYQRTLTPASDSPTGHIVVKNTLTVKNSIIPVKELKKASFSTLQKNFNQCYMNHILVYRLKKS